MFEFLSHNPFIAFWILIMLPAVIGTAGHYWNRDRQQERLAQLKHAMIQRGMSADEIVRVLAAGSEQDAKEPVTA
jgi:hypothetical protein